MIDGAARMVSAATAGLEDHVAATDCERLVGLWGDVVVQPVNTVSSLVMGCFGLYLLLRSGGWPDPPRRLTLALTGAALFSTGIGSALYHGPGGLFGQVVHDVTIAAIPMAAALGMAAERRGFDAVRWLLGALAVTTVLQAVGPSHLFAAALAAIVLVRLGIDRYRDGLVEIGPLVAGGFLFVSARLAFGLSRTGEPLCRADSVWQGHALWHLLVGAGVVALAAGLGLLPDSGRDDENRSIRSGSLR